MNTPRSYVHLSTLHATWYFCILLVVEHFDFSLVAIVRFDCHIHSVWHHTGVHLLSPGRYRCWLWLL